MASEAPPFWWQPTDWRAISLYPVSMIVGAIAARRMRNAPRVPVSAPVLCVGNFTVGGTGKTPTVIALAKAALAAGHRPGILSRGHGGAFQQPHLVDAGHDSARHVGDEPLLLAAHAPVAVTPNRLSGARLLIAQGCDFLIMDDGFQSARIAIDHALAIIDARHGLGNGHVIPGGPLRAPLDEQMRHVDSLLCMGKGNSAVDVVRIAARAGKPVLQARTVPVGYSALAGERFVAFAGIGHPQRFFDSAAETGAILVESRSFGDHHFYQPDELADLASTASKNGCGLLTTSKDAARLRHGILPDEFAERLTVLEVETVFDDPATPNRLIAATLGAWERRKMG